MIYKIISFLLFSPSSPVRGHRSGGYQSSRFRLSQNISAVSRHFDSISGCATLCLALGEGFKMSLKFKIDKV